MENVTTLKAETRNQVGKKIARQLRRTGKIPAIIYGGDKESVPVSLLVDDIKSILRSGKKENTVLRIQRDKLNIDAMLKEVQYDYLSDNIIHVDLIRIDLEKPVIVDVPIKLEGEAVGVKVEDGVFDFNNREIKVKCLVTQIPDEVIFDVSELHIGQSVKAKELDIEEHVQLISNPNAVICSISGKCKME